MTQENLRAPGFTERQTMVKIGEESVWIDHEMVDLIKALNNIGLKTRSHCSGHGDSPSFVAISLDSIENIEIRKHDDYNEIILMWNK